MGGSHYSSFASYAAVMISKAETVSSTPEESKEITLVNK